MSGNSFGKIFKITTFGESHGPALGVVIDGVLPGIGLTINDIQSELDKRRPGQNNITTQRKEKDSVEILSGMFKGKTTGAPLTLLIRNDDTKSEDYSNIKDVFRPGHADYTYFKKYGTRDYRGGGRSSGRETVARVAAGAVAKKILSEHSINIVAYTLSISDVVAKKIDYSVIEKNPIRTADLSVVDDMLQKIEEAKANNDSVGGVIEAIVHGTPAGLGDPVFEKLTAKLAGGIMSIPATKGIEFGSGFKSSTMLGSEHNDRFYMDGDRVRVTTNNAGGILGGISTGEDIVLRVAIKPTSSIAQNQQTVSAEEDDVNIEVRGRHDPCICPRVVSVVESMIALVLLDALMIQKTIK
ncbi:MAG: chorismate synthase [Candidatus Zapsychrus exili]|nr:chorismate synthase [Candidatus Zapsychrus exili]